MSDLLAPGSQPGTHKAKSEPQKNAAPVEGTNSGTSTFVGGGSIAQPVVAGPTKGRPDNDPPGLGDSYGR